MEKLNQQNSLDLNKSLRLIQDSFDNALDAIGNKENALLEIRNKYEDIQLFQSNEMGVYIRGLGINPEGTLYLDLKFKIEYNKKIILNQWDSFSFYYYDVDYVTFDIEFRVRLNQIEIENIIAQRNQILKDYIQFVENGYEFQYRKNSVTKKCVSNSWNYKTLDVYEVYKYLVLEFKEDFILENKGSSVVAEFVVSEEEKKYMVLDVVPKGIFISFEGIEFQVANNIYDGVDQKVKNIIEIIKLRSQVNSIVEDTKTKLWELFANKKETSISEELEKCFRVGQVFSQMKKKGEKRESAIMIAFIQDIIIDIRDDKVDISDIKDYQIMIKEGNIKSILKYYNNKISELFSSQNDDILDEIDRISKIYSQVYNNYPKESEELLEIIAEIIYKKMFREDIDQINTDYIDVFANVFGEQKFYSKFLEFFLKEDKLFQYKTDSIIFDKYFVNVFGEQKFYSKFLEFFLKEDKLFQYKTDSIIFDKYDLLPTSIWDKENIKIFTDQFLIPYMTKLLLENNSGFDLETCKNLDLDILFQELKLEFSFMKYIKDYLLSINFGFREIYQTLLRGFLKRDIELTMELTKERKLPDLTKYNVEFNINNDNISESSKDLFLDLIKDTIIFLLKSNPSILEKEYNLISLLDVLGYTEDIPFVEYIKYAARFDRDKIYIDIMKELYDFHLQEDKQKMGEDIYFDKYIHILPFVEDNTFISDLFLPYFQKRIDENPNILEKLEFISLENMVKACGIYNEGFFNYISLNLDKDYKSKIVSEIILPKFQKYIYEDGNYIKNNKLVDLWKYDLFFSTDTLVANIQESFIIPILIPSLRFDLVENLQVLENKDNMSFYDLLVGLGYGDFAFAKYIKNNISEEEQQKYLNMLGEKIIDQIVSNYRNAKITKKIQIIEKYKNLWLILSTSVKKSFVSIFLSSTLSSHIDRDINRIKESKVKNLDYLLQDYEIYHIYIKNKYIEEYTDKLHKCFYDVQKKELLSVHKTMLSSINDGKDIDLEETIQDYQKYIGIPSDELAQIIDELENNYNNTFKQGENKLGVAYAKVYEKMQFDKDNLKNLLDSYKEYIDKYFVQDRLSKEEKIILEQMMYTACILYLLLVIGEYKAASSGVVKYIINFARGEYGKYIRGAEQISNFIEELENLASSGIKKDLNYLLFMLNIYKNTCKKISVSGYTDLEYITVKENEIDLKLKEKKSEFNTKTLYDIVEILFLHRINKIYSPLVKEQMMGRMSGGFSSSDAPSRIAKVLSYKNLSYEELKLFRNKLSDIIYSDNIKFLPQNSPLVINFKYAT